MSYLLLPLELQSKVAFEVVHQEDLQQRRICLHPFCLLFSGLAILTGLLFHSDCNLHIKPIKFRQRFFSGTCIKSDEDSYALFTLGKQRIFHLLCLHQNEQRGFQRMQLVLCMLYDLRLKLLPLPRNLSLQIIHWR